jgi:hypothetical protein
MEPVSNLTIEIQTIKGIVKVTMFIDLYAIKNTLTGLP